MSTPGTRTLSPEQTYNRWRNFFQGLRPCHVVPLGAPGSATISENASHEEKLDEAELHCTNTDVQASLISAFCNDCEIDLECLLRTSWAITVACLAGVEDVTYLCQGYRGELENDIAIYSHHLAASLDVRSLLENVRHDSAVCSHHLASGLDLQKLFDRHYNFKENQQIRSSNDTTTAGILSFDTDLPFDTALRIVSTDSSIESRLDVPKQGSLKVFADVLLDVNHEATLRIRTVLDSLQGSMRATDVVHTWFKILKSLITSDAKEKTLGELEIVSDRDIETINGWNETIDPTVDACFHDVLSHVARETPNAPAICSSEGHDYTYAQLDVTSTKLANYLVHELGNTMTGTAVPICFDKSSLALVTMLSIFKAGGAFVIIDPCYPDTRIQAIMKATAANAVLTHPKFRHLFDNCKLEKVISLDHSRLAELKLPRDQPPYTPCVSPSDVAYIHFTSGSTGTPKGMLIEHRSLCTASYALARPMGISKDSRMFQWAAYMFDLSFGDIFVTLSQGGCICVPTENERINDLPGAMQRMRVDTACLIPSIARIFSPQDVPGLNTLSLGGEALSSDNFETWAEQVRVNVMYGPSECTIWCTSATKLRKDSPPNIIGRGVGVKLWVVNSINHDQLLPIGTIGELLVEGDTLARGYLDPEQTRRSFIENPTWAMADNIRKTRRFYKTGDLVKYTSDGNLLFLGRKDTQIKLNGRRIELGEVEHCLTACSQVEQSIALVPLQGLHSKRLVAVLVLGDRESADDTHADPIEKTENPDQSKLKQVQDHLSSNLPIYMLPSAWIVVRRIPRLLSGKMNRPAVQAFVETLTASAPISDLTSHLQGEEPTNPEQIAQLSTQDNESVDSLVRSVREAWARVLKLPAVTARTFDTVLDSCEKERSFVDMGGDSFAAMELVSLCRKEGLTMTVADIMDVNSGYSTIRQMAAAMRARCAREGPDHVMVKLPWKSRPIWWQ
jgi:amino acid adenylation domain-containing protein